MKSIYTLFLIGLVFVSTDLLAQKEIPALELKTLTGKSVLLKDAVSKGKITVLSIWATWCKPCHKELDAIAEFYEDWQKDYNVELIAVTIDTQRALSKVKPMVSAYGWDYTILSDVNNSISQAMNFQSIPQIFLIDRNGKIVYAHSGYVPGAEYELEAEIVKIVE